jgi:hypothetical protein
MKYILNSGVNLFPTAPWIGKFKYKMADFYWSVIQAVGFFDFIDIGP